MPPTAAQPAEDQEGGKARLERPSPSLRVAGDTSHDIRRVRYPHFDDEHRVWFGPNSARWMLVPTISELAAMLSELLAVAGSVKMLAALMGMPVSTVHRWLIEPAGAATTVRRVIWLHWCLLLHPERIQTEFDLVTWGRFRVPKRVRRRAPARPAEAPKPDSK